MSSPPSTRQSLNATQNLHSFRKTEELPKVRLVINMLLHGIDVPTNVRHDNSEAHADPDELLQEYLARASPATQVEVTENGEPRDVSLRFLQFCFSVPPVDARARQRRLP